MMDSWGQIIEISGFEGDDVDLFSFVDESIGEIYGDPFSASSFQGIYEKIIIIFHVRPFTDKCNDISQCSYSDQTPYAHIA